MVGPFQTSIIKTTFQSFFALTVETCKNRQALIREVIQLVGFEQASLWLKFSLKLKEALADKTLVINMRTILTKCTVFHEVKTVHDIYRLSNIPNTKV